MNYNEWLNANTNVLDPLVLEDSMVYFWRVAIDSTVPQWKEYSFQYIKGKEGWGQDHFFQFKNGYFNSINYNRQIRQREFEPVETIIHAKVVDHTAAGGAPYNLWGVNGSSEEYDMCGLSPSIYVGVVDPYTLEAWQTNTTSSPNPAMSFGNVNDGSSCRSRPERYFIFRQNSTQQLQALENMLLSIPDGHYYVVYAAGYAQYNNWQNLQPSLFSTFQNVLGSDSLYLGQDEMAFIHIGKKGDPSLTTEKVAQYLYDI